MSPLDLSQRIRNHAEWRVWNVQKQLLARSGWLSRRTLWPVPGGEPYRRNHLHLWRSGQLGDVLLCTPALRKLKEINPRCRLTFHTEAISLIEGLTFVDNVRPLHDYRDLPAGNINLSYEPCIPPQSVPPRRHLAKILGDLLGFEVRNIRPSCKFNKDMLRYYITLLSHFRKPWIVVNRYASAWTPNKTWPEALWDDLIDRLVTWSTVIEIGTFFPSISRLDCDRYLNLVGRLSLEQLVALIAAADLKVGPISGPIHIAAAFSVPSVVIFGGYEHPISTHYPGNIDLYSAVPCAPCWLRDPCPFDRKCLRQIDPSVVEYALKRLWKRRDLRYNP
jgi:ADP-heptose:LPS heptosyltransferase